MKFLDRAILFKETIRMEARGYYKLKKQTGGPGQFFPRWPEDIPPKLREPQAAG